MLSENIKRLRKQKGYSQETLAQQLNVVRQTVSKWEKGYSVPDAEMLEKMAELFEVPVSELLDKEASIHMEPNESNAIVQQLTILNEQLARQIKTRKRTFWTILISILIILLVGTILYLLLFSSFSFNSSTHTSHETGHTDLSCTLDGSTYSYSVSYDDQYNVVSAGGHQWIADHIIPEQYDDANILTAQIDDYFKVRGGNCRITHHTEKHSIHHHNE